MTIDRQVLFQNLVPRPRAFYHQVSGPVAAVLASVPPIRGIEW